MDAGGVAIVDPHVCLLRATDREAADQVEALVALEATAALGDQPAIGSPRRLRVGGRGVEASRVRGGCHRPAQVLEGAARNHEHEQVEDGEEAELEGNAYGVIVHATGTLMTEPGGAMLRPRSSE